MKTKHFFCNSIYAASGHLEKQINEFIEDKEVIDIKYSSSLAFPGVGIRDADYSALVIYKD
ncbi:hypothetical protein [Streptococcus phage smHBZ8]|nr:hypothetical protein [Streptococcus phage smHBZ8]